MKKIWLMLAAICQMLVNLNVAYAQDVEESGKNAEPTVSCRSLANPQTEDQMDEFRECIERFNEERKSTRKLELIQKKFGASQMLTDQYNSSEKRQPLKLALDVIELKFMASEKLTKRIKSKPHTTGNTLSAGSE